MHYGIWWGATAVSKHTYLNVGIFFSYTFSAFCRLCINVIIVVQDELTLVIENEKRGLVYYRDWGGS